jgi:hypothetical protein
MIPCNEDGTVPATIALPSSQISTLTPPAAITGFATSSKQDDIKNAVNDPFYGKTLITKTVDFTGSATGNVWVPTSGKKFCVTDVVLSFSADGTISVFDSTDTTANRVFKFSGKVGGGAVINYRIPRISSTANNNLNWLTGSGAAGYLTVHGYEV